MPKLLKDRPAEKHCVKVRVGKVTLEGILCLPAGATGIVVFVHGSGSSRFSPRNQFVARVLNAAGMATFLFDLLTPDEEDVDVQNGKMRFNIDLLSTRVLEITKWLKQNNETANLDIGYFGASTGAAAALVAASRQPHLIKAVVSRGGRPELAGQALSYVAAPTLLIVGGEDWPVIGLNQKALEKLPSTTQKALSIVPEATHLFDEPGTLEQAAALACDWFQKQLGKDNLAQMQ